MSSRCGGRNEEFRVHQGASAKHKITWIILQLNAFFFSPSWDQ